MNPIILDKIIILINDPSFIEADKKLKQASFSNKDELSILLKNYCILYNKNSGRNLLREISMRIQKLYQTNSKVGNFFDNI